MDADWTDMERGAALNFLSAPGPLKGALEKFTKAKADHHRAMCTMNMATVPRNPEAAADHAAKAQVLDEFWTLLAEDVLSEAQVPATVS